MTSSSPEKESLVMSNVFGTVTTKRVTYLAQKGWFGGGSREDVPLKQVVSVRHETDRKVFIGLLLIVLGLILLFAIVGVIPLALGALLLWGSPAVNVVTAGGTGKPMIGFPWQKQEAEAFVSALRGQLFSE